MKIDKEKLYAIAFYLMMILGLAILLIPFPILLVILFYVISNQIHSLGYSIILGFVCVITMILYYVFVFIWMSTLD